MPQLPPEWASHPGSGCSNRLGACTSDGAPEICRTLASRQRLDGRMEVLDGDFGLRIERGGRRQYRLVARGPRVISP